MKHHDPGSGQTEQSVARNTSFFRKHRDEYNKNVQELDTYKAMRASLNETLQGIDRLLDIGNGGVFDYDTTGIGSIVALDLFLEDLPLVCPSNVTLRTGSALNIPEMNGSFDGVLLAMLIHHLIGKTLDESLRNVRCSVREAFRVSKPGGKLIIVESCVSTWFYLFERTVFPMASPLINAILSHPATLQYPASVITSIIREYTSSIEVTRIPKGQWILQFGVTFPAMLTPASPYRFIAYKPDADRAR